MRFSGNSAVSRVSGFRIHWSGFEKGTLSGGNFTTVRSSCMWTFRLALWEVSLVLRPERKNLILTEMSGCRDSNSCSFKWTYCSCFCFCMLLLLSLARQGVGKHDWKTCESSISDCPLLFISRYRYFLKTYCDLMYSSHWSSQTWYMVNVLQ